jgi:Ni/Co efflux regulator RcnB
MLNIREKLLPGNIAPAASAASAASLASTASAAASLGRHDHMCDRHVRTKAAWHRENPGDSEKRRVQQPLQGTGSIKGSIPL